MEIKEQKIYKNNLTNSVLNILVISLLYFSCTADQINNGAKREVNLSVVDRITLKVDELFSIETVSNFFLSTKQGKELLTLRLGELIYDIDLSTGKQLGRYSIPLEGPNSIDNFSEFDGIARLKNSNYLYVSHFLGDMYRISPDTIQRVGQLTNDQSNQFRFFTSSYAPVLLFNNFLAIGHIANSRFSLEDTPSFSLLNVETNEIIHPFFYPSIYNKHFWGDHPYQYLPNIQYIDKVNKFYVSYPIDEWIYVYDEKFNFENKVLVKSNEISTIAPFRPKPLGVDETYDYNEDKEYFRNLSYYFTCFYDSKNEKYYRVVKKVNIEKDGERNRVYYLIICNLSLEIIDEVKLDSKYNVLYSFMSSKGLMLFDASKFSDDAEIPYDLVKFE